MRERDVWVAHAVESSVDALLAGRRPMVQRRTRGPDGVKVQGVMALKSPFYVGERETGAWLLQGHFVYRKEL